MHATCVLFFDQRSKKTIVLICRNLTFLKHQAGAMVLAQITKKKIDLLKTKYKCDSKKISLLIVKSYQLKGT